MLEVMEQAFSSPDFTDACERIAERVLQFLPVRFSAIGVVDDQRTFQIVADAGGEAFRRGRPSDTCTIAAGAGVTGRAIVEGQPYRVADVLNDPRIALPESLRVGVVAAGVRAVLAVPLRTGPNVVGALTVGDSAVREFTDGDVRMLQVFADHAAVSLDNARLAAIAAAREDQLRQAQKMEALGRLAASVAHDFNNMLAMMIGPSQLLDNALDAADPRKRWVRSIRAVLERASTLTRQLLDFSRRRPLEPTVIDLNALLPPLLILLRPLLGRSVEIEADLAPDLAPVRADAGQIEQIVMNLAVNARDAMPEGGPLTLTTANVELDDAFAQSHLGVAPGPYVMLRVRDTGVGMTADVAARIFEPFFTTKGAGEGTGLGLSTVHGIVTRHHGTITVESEPGRGTTFRVFLPRADEG